MTKENTTPPPEPKELDHQPPSLPTSPLPKRTKTSNQDNQEKDNPAPPTASIDSVMASSKPSTALPPLFVKKLTDSAQAPTRGSALAAGYDIYGAKETVIPARGKAMVDTGISIAVPEGTCMCFSSFIHSFFFFFFFFYQNFNLPKMIKTDEMNFCIWPYCSPQWTCSKTFH